MPNWQLDGGFKIPYGDSGSGRDTDHHPDMNGGNYSGYDYDETIIGTLKDDHIHGWGGDDVIWGDTDGTLGGYAVGGNDRPSGDAAGNGQDLLIGDARDIVGHARGGGDFMYSDNNDDTIYGDAYNSLQDQAQGGDDYMNGMDGNDFVVGDAAFMYDQSIGGDDTLRGGPVGNDRLVGDAKQMYDDSKGGDDLLYGKAGDDQLYGDSFVANGNSRGGNDKLYGEEGDDRLNGGRGDDYLVGGVDKDVFEFSGGNGNDLIVDFKRGTDTIELRGFKGVDFNDLDIATVGGKVVIDLGAYGAHVPGLDLINVSGVTSLSAADIDFV